MHRQYSMVAVPLVDGVMAREATRLRDFDRAVDELTTSGGTIWIPLASTTLVEALLQRAAKGDLDEAQAAADRLAALPTDPGLVLKDIWLPRSRALLAQAQGDEAAYRLHRDQYRTMATDLGFEGHIAMAYAMQ
jgi:adenylate cyclase